MPLALAPLVAPDDPLQLLELEPSMLPEPEVPLMVPGSPVPDVPVPVPLVPVPDVPVPVPDVPVPVVPVPQAPEPDVPVPMSEVPLPGLPVPLVEPLVPESIEVPALPPVEGIDPLPVVVPLVVPVPVPIDPVVLLPEPVLPAPLVPLPIEPLPALVPPDPLPPAPEPPLPCAIAVVAPAASMIATEAANILRICCPLPDDCPLPLQQGGLPASPARSKPIGSRIVQVYLCRNAFRSEDTVSRRGGATSRTAPTSEHFSGNQTSDLNGKLIYISKAAAMPPRSSPGSREGIGQ